MKILIARLNHETNTFSPVPTPLAAFGGHGPDYDAAAYASQKGERTAMGAFIELAESVHADIVTPLSAWANPSGRVDAHAYKAMCDRIVQAAAGCDALMLDLHGAMAVENTDDGEGDLLEQLRSRFPGIPITVALDLHGNVTQKMVDNADILVGFKTYPHVDMYETGLLAGQLLLDKLEGTKTPVTAWRQLPLMTHTLTSSTQAPAMKRAVATATQMEQDGDALAVTVMAGFSLADIPAPCLSILVVGEDAIAAQKAADRLATAVWAEKEGFVYRSLPLSESIRQAIDLNSQQGVVQPQCGDANGPVLLLDHSDNCMSGGTCDTMDVLQEARAQGIVSIAVGPLCDPEAVAAMFEAGEGASLSIALGNKRPLTSLGIQKTPVTLTGRIQRLSNGEYVITGPTYHGMKFSMGRTALFVSGDMEIIVTETPHEPWDLGVFSCVGVDPTKKEYVLLKSRMYCRPVFLPIAKAFVECDSEGVTSSNYSLFPFKNVRHPVYPLDDIAEWAPA